jgi:hypothetical protein
MLVNDGFVDELEHLPSTQNQNPRVANHPGVVCAPLRGSTSPIDVDRSIAEPAK